MSSDVGVQAGFDPWPTTGVHLEWGVPGAALASARGDIVVIVDVMSFSTSLAIAASRDFTCLVYSGAEIELMGGLEAAAAGLHARALSKRRKVVPGEISLSPRSLLAAERGQRVLFTSLNGAAVLATAAEAPALLVGGLRNARACADQVHALLRDGVADRVTVVACGEHWSSVEPDTGGTRMALEDWLGAGLICHRLVAAGHTLSAEAACAAAAWAGPQPSHLLATCVSARELIASGFTDDVALSLQVDADSSVPVRVEGEASGRVFVAAPNHVVVD